MPPTFLRFPWQFAGIHLYCWVESGTVRLKCLAQLHNDTPTCFKLESVFCVFSKTYKYILLQMVGIRTPSESGYALFTDNPVNLVEHCLQTSVKVRINEVFFSKARFKRHSIVASNLLLVGRDCTLTIDSM